MAINPVNVMLQLNEFRKSGKYCDVSITVGKCVFRSHRSVLAAASRYFDIMFGSDFKESAAKEIELRDIDDGGFEIFLEYIYTGELNFDEDSAKVLPISSYLQANCLSEKCVNYMMENITLQNVLDYHMCADGVACDRLKMCTLEFIQENFHTIVKNGSIVDTTFRALKELISHDKTLVDKEEFIFEVITKWVNHDRENRSQYISDLLKCIRFKFIELKYIHEDILQNNLLSDSADSYMNTILETRAMDFDARKKKYIHIFRSNHSSNVSVLRLDGSTTEEVGSMKYEMNGIFGATAVVCKEKMYLCTFKRPNETNVCCFIDDQWILLNDTRNLGLTTSSMIALDSYNCIYASVYNPDRQKSDIQCYNVELNQWSVLGTANDLDPLGFNINYPTLVSHENVIFLCGGINSQTHVLSDVHLLDPRIKIFTRMCPMKNSLIYAAGASVQNKLYVSGGRCESSALNTMQMYDIRADSWEMVKPMATTRYKHSLILLNNKLHSLCGFDTKEVEVYDPTKDRWLQTYHLDFSSFESAVLF